METIVMLSGAKLLIMEIIVMLLAMLQDTLTSQKQSLLTMAIMHMFLM